MTMGLIYPNPEKERMRLFLILFAYLAISPFIILLGYDVYKCWYRRDMVAIIRHSTAVGPLLGIFMKVLIMYFKRNQVKQLIDEINVDYASYNQLSKAYQDIAADELKNNRTTEKRWAACVFFCALIMILATALLTIYSQIFDAEPQKYLIHELNPPVGDPESKSNSPYYELMFIYECYGSIYYVLNFIGFDGFFVVLINHACLKIKICCQSFSDALKGVDEVDIKRLLCNSVRDQCRIFSFINTIQQTFSVWLIVVFMATMMQICNCMYLIIEGPGFDFRYIIFTMCIIVHIFLPCWYCTKLNSVSLETSTLVYFSNWEDVPIPRVWKMVQFIIMQGQVPLEITALNIIKFDMELFVSILQTSYSMFTLLKSSQ